jgi:hypothetical protein
MYITKGVLIEMGYGLGGPGSIPGGARFSLLHSVQTDLRPRMVDLYLGSPLCLHGIVLN